MGIEKPYNNLNNVTSKLKILKSNLSDCNETQTHSHLARKMVECSFMN